MTNFINLFSTTNQTQYSFIYQDQDSLKQNRFDSNCVFNIKIIIDLSSKIRLQITSKNESNFKKNREFNLKKNKNKKLFKQKNHAYMTKNDEKKIDYYKLNNNNDDSNDNDNSNIYHDDENSFESFDQKIFSWKYLISFWLKTNHHESNVKNVKPHFC